MVFTTDISIIELFPVPFNFLELNPLHDL